MKVFVLNQHGEPLMPCSPRKARILLKEEKAKVVSREPFTIQLLYGSSGYKQDITIGVDTGHSNVGVSVISGKKELNSYEFKLRNDISKKMTSRKMYRNKRRSRLRYRKPRFNNRSASRRKGRLPPSVSWKVNAHIRLIDLIRNRLPKSRLVVETASFDTQKLENPNITNEQYQRGVQYGFANVREYILHRDKHKCQASKAGCSVKLQVHHINFKNNGGSDKPSNLITLCEKHHKQLHNGKFEVTSKRNISLKAASTMSIIRKRLLEYYPNAIETFGYVTKRNRFEYNIDKSHANDAFVIAGGIDQERSKTQNWDFKRKNNRVLQTNRKGCKRSIRTQRYSLRPKDIVEFENEKYLVRGITSWGRMCMIENEKYKTSRTVKKLKLIFHRKSLYQI